MAIRQGSAWRGNRETVGLKGRKQKRRAFDRRCCKSAVLRYPAKWLVPISKKQSDERRLAQTENESVRVAALIYRDYTMT